MKLFVRLDIPVLVALHGIVILSEMHIGIDWDQMAFRVAQATNKHHALIHVFDLLELRMIVGCDERPEVFNHILIHQLLEVAKARTALVPVQLPNKPDEKAKKTRKSGRKPRPK